VHSKEQIRASGESGGNALLQFSQVGLNSSILHALHVTLPRVQSRMSTT
jgi:hypothetical protein